MARKQLNKKVALIGSAVFVLVVLAAIAVFLRLTQKPDEFIKDGDAALLVKDYNEAVRSYNKAIGLTKTDSLRKVMHFKLADVYIETDEWPKVLGHWSAIVQIAPKNTKARFGRLKYYYIIADSVGTVSIWQETLTQASEFIDVVEDTELLREDTAEWDPYKKPDEAGEGQLGPFLYLVRGRAFLEIAKMQAVADPNEYLTQAIEDLKKVQKLQPEHIDAYWYLAQATITKGDILTAQGDPEEKDKAAKKAQVYLKQAIEVADDNVKAHINLLTTRLTLSTIEQRQSLEPEYLSLVDKFPSNPQAHWALASFYLSLGLKNLDDAEQALANAIELDPENVIYARFAANLYYRKFSIYNQKPWLIKAIEVAGNALTFPGAQQSKGPEQWVNRTNRLSLYTFLANCYLEQLLQIGDRQSPAAIALLKDAELAVHEIEQLVGSGEDPRVIKWRGMLELARGNTSVAVRNLYDVYEKDKASRPPALRDAQLSYNLARVFQNTSEIGAVTEFMTTALNAGYAAVKPDVYLDYVEILLRFRLFSAAMPNLKAYEDNFGPNERSRMLRISAYIAASQFDQAEAEIAKRKQDDPNTIRLNMVLLQSKIRQMQRSLAQRESAALLPGAEKDKVELSTAEEQLIKNQLKSYREAVGGLAEQLLLMEPNSVGGGYIAVVCEHYIAEKEIKKAKDLVDKYLDYFPENATARFYKQLLLEPEPDKIPQQRRRELEKDVLSNISEPAVRAMSLGTFYQRNNEPNKAAGEFRKVLDVDDWAGRVVTDELATDRPEEMTNPQRFAAAYIFRLSLASKDWNLAEQIVEIVRRKNLDDCDGKFFAARIAAAKGQYNDAVSLIDECLLLRPVFSRAYMLRSSVNNALGNERASIEDAQRAYSLNPLDGSIARVLAGVLYARNKRLGGNVSPDQILEEEAAWNRALALNPADLQLRSLYAQYLTEKKPQDALAILQNLQKVTPSVDNAVLLGKIATKVAQEQIHPELKRAYFDIAAESFEQAQKSEPNNEEMLSEYARYYTARGEDEKAEQLLVQSNDKIMLWDYYYRVGKFENAKAVLEQLYSDDVKDSNIVKGLLLVAEKTADKDAARKYSEKLLSLENTIDNHLYQVQAFLRLGLVKEAEHKLQSFNEKYPDEQRTLLFEAWLAMKKGQLRKALNLTNRYLEADQNNAMPWRLRGEINYLLAKYEQAISDLKMSRLLADEPSTRVVLAKAYRRASREDEAITELKSTIDHPQAPMEARLLLELIYTQLRRKADLIKFYDDSIAKFPDSGFWYNRAGAFAVAQNNLSLAEQLYQLGWQKNVEANDKRAAEDAFDRYLHVLLLAGKLDKVFEEAGKHVDADFAAVAYLRMAEAKLKMNDKQTAAQYCQKALDKAAQNEILELRVLQKMYSLLGEKEVLTYCKERLQKNPDSLAANYTMFNLMRLNDQYNKAIEYIDRCLELAQPDSPSRTNYILGKTAVLGMAYTKTSDNDYLARAIEQYESLLPKMPSNTVILNNLAYMLADGDMRLEEALEYAERAHRIKPNDPGLLDTYAYVLYKNGKYDQAVEYLQSAKQLYEQEAVSAPAEVYEHLGMIKEKLGANLEAVAAYKQALEDGAAQMSEVSKERIRKAIERLLR